MRRPRRGLVRAGAFAAVLAVGAAQPSEASAEPTLRVPLTVRAPHAAAALTLPATAGVPLPQGALREPEGLVVRDGDRSLFAQARVLSRWPDRSVRWLLVDWQSSLRTGEARRVHLGAGGGVPPPEAAVRVSHKPDKLIVDTGAARFVVPLSGPALLAAAGADGESPVEMTGYIVLDGVRHDVDGRRTVEVVDEGPWRVRLRVRGSLGAFRQEVRFDFFAGLRSVRVLHSIENHASARYTSLDDLAVVVRLPEALASCQFGLEGGRRLPLTLGEGKGMVTQIDAQRLAVDGRLRTARGSGWSACAYGRHHAAIGARFFWQEYPQGFGSRPGAMVYHMRAPTERPMPFGSGAAKTHEFWLLARGSAAEAEALEALAKSPLPWVDAGWTERSGALRNSLAPRPATEPFLAQLDAAMAGYFVTQDREEWDDSGRITCSDGDENRRVGAYGMLNWGDWNFRGFRDNVKGCDAWGNLEYDTTQVLGLAFAARGKAAYAEAMAAAARHFADVDRIHFHAEHSSWIGMNHPKNPLHFTFELGGIDLGHTWNEGLFTYGLMTGDDRVLRAGLEIADYLVRRRGGGVTFRGNPRQWGWPQVALVAAWEFSGDERYREAALWYAQRGLFTHPPEAEGDWKRGILAEALGYTHSVTGDATILAWLRGYGERIAAERPADPRYYPALAYAGRAAGEEAWVRLAQASVAQVRVGRWGKPLTLAGRIGFATLSVAAPPPENPSWLKE